ncbi:hypothetical protein F4814DRAFT_416661 [Daldinia grandis]|nr:hypothetical protein F4814DRAFT_416661 [Daldinia grandis]
MKQPQKIDQGTSLCKFQETNNNSDSLSRSGGLVDAVAQRRTTASRQRTSRGEHRIQGRSSFNNVEMKSVRNTPTQSKTSDESHDPERDQGHSIFKGSKEVVDHCGNAGTTKTAAEDIEKTAIVRFEKKGKDGIISEEPDYTDDEYRPVSNNEEQLGEDSNDEQALPRRARATNPSKAINNMPSPPSPGRKLRSRSYPKPTTLFTPTSKPTAGNQERKSTTTSSRMSGLGKGHSKRVRAITSTADLDFDSDSDPKESREGENDKNDKRPTEFERMPWWAPQAWIERYETGFMIDFNVADRLWLGIGPFMGWISDGPGKGTYMPGYGPPDDATIAKAEKTAVLRYHLRTYDSDSEDHEQWERDYFPDEKKLHKDEDGGNSTRLASDNPYCPTSPREEELHCIARLADPDQATLLKAKAIEQAERAEKTQQYVLTGNPSGNFNSQVTDSYDPRSSRTQGKLFAHPVPTAKSDDSTSPPSAASETTSTLITRQLVADCASLSSPTDRRTKASSSTRHVNKPCSSDDGRSSIPTRRGQSMPVGLRHPSAKPINTKAEPESFIPPNTSTKTNIEVVLPFMSVEERAEYDVVSQIDDDKFTPLPATSFKEINEATPSLSPESDGSGEETLNYVLRQSPTWLHNITEVVEPRDTIANMTKPASKLLVKSSLKKPSVVLRIPRSPRSPREPRRQLFKATAANNSRTNQNYLPRTEPKGKRKASFTGFSTAGEPPTSKKQKADNCPSFKKDTRLSQRRRRRMRRRGEEQMRDNIS